MDIPPPLSLHVYIYQRCDSFYNHICQYLAHRPVECICLDTSSIHSFQYVCLVSVTGEALFWVLLGEETDRNPVFMELIFYQGRLKK